MVSTFIHVMKHLSSDNGSFNLHPERPHPKISDWNTIQPVYILRIITMGRKAKLKQSGPTPLPGSSSDKRRNKGKKKASTDSYKSLKAIKVAGLKVGKGKKRQVDVEDEDSDVEDAMRPG